MKFLVVGLGSMGRRRIRNLKALGYKDISGFDIRSDRAKQVAEEYAIKTFDNFENALTNCSPEALIVSTSPDCHMHYAFLAYQHNIHCFIEASVVDAEKILELYYLSKNSSLIFAPSCTMRYTASVRKITELLELSVIGNVLNINYQVGQYLPDWHPWENIQDYYVSKNQTGGCRELVPFELTWLTQIFGKAEPLALVKTKLSQMQAPIDDIYHSILMFEKNIMLNLTIEVLSQPYATRELRIIGDEGILTFSGSDNVVRYINNKEKIWHSFALDNGTIEKNYINPEEPYIAEIKDFVTAISQSNQHLFPNTLLKDYDVLQTLNKMEALAHHDRRYTEKTA